jgi:WD40 repeat protein
VAFSPDGKTLASVDEQRNLILWDVANPRAPRQKRTIRVSNGADGQYNVAFSPDGKFLAAGGADRNIQVLNAADLSPVHGLAGHTGPIRSLSFSKAGFLASAGDDRTVRVWNIHAPEGKAERFASREGHSGYVYAAAFGPGAATVLSAGDDKLLRLWNLKTESGEPELVTIPTTHFSTIRSLAYSKDGKRAATGGYDMRVILYDLVERKQTVVISGPSAHSGEVLCVAFSADGNTLASGSQDETVRIWDPHTGREYSAPLVGHRKPVTAVAFAPDGQTMATGAEDGGVRLWDHVLGKPLHILPGFTEPVRAVTYSADGKMLAAGSEDGSLRIWETAGGIEVIAFTGVRGGVHGLAFSPDGKALVVATTLGELVAYDPHDGGLLRWAQYVTPLESVAFSPDGRTLLTANGNTSLYLIDPTRAGDPLTAMESSQVDGDAALYVKTLRDDRDVKNLKTAAAGLGRLGKDAPPAALPALINRLHEDNAEVQTAAINALAAVGPSAVPALITAYKTAVANNRRRLAVLTTLGAMGADAVAAVPMLSSALSDKTPEIRTAAAGALGRLGPGAVAAMLPLLSSNDAGVRGAAEAALLNDRMLPIVIKAAGRDRDARTRLTALAAIARMGDKAEARAMPVLFEALQDKDPAIRAAGIRTIGAVGSGDRDTVEMLALLMSVTEEDRAVRLAAAQAIGAFGRPAAHAAASLLGLFEEPRAEDLQLIAGEALAKLGPLPTEAVPALLKALDDKRYQVRVRIAEVIGNLGTEARDYAAEIQKRISAEQDEEVRRKLGEALKKITAE